MLQRPDTRVSLYFEGILKGKYRGDIDLFDSDKRWQNYYNYEIYEGIISLPKYDFIHVDEVKKIKKTLDSYQDIPDYEAPLTNQILLEVFDGEIVRLFRADIHGLKLKDIRLFNRQQEGISKVFGEIEASAFGYLVDEYPEENEKYLALDDSANSEKVLINVSPLSPEVSKLAGGEIASQDKIPNFSGSVSSIKDTLPNPSSFIGRKTQFKKGYIRYNDSATGAENHWGPWEKNRFSYWDKKVDEWIMRGIHPLFFPLAIFLFVLLIWFVPEILSLLTVLFFLALVYLFLVLLMALLLFFFLENSLISAISFVLLILTIFYGSTLSDKIEQVKWEESEYDSEKEKLPDPDNIAVENDNTFKQQRVWRDFSGNIYEAIISVSEKDFLKSAKWRNNYPSNFSSVEDYNSYLAKASRFDSSALTCVYEELHRIRNTQQLNKKEFAEVLITFVQDIPYTLILDDACDARLYNDMFIRKYLSENKICYGNQRFGILNPAEFMSTILGDCDTRTLFLFTVFKHFQYDVAILGSTEFRHSILGIHLPYQGIHKKIDGKSYFVVETTSKGMYPGILAPGISKMEKWDINVK
jgi:hypothetical protein